MVEKGPKRYALDEVQSALRVLCRLVSEFQVPPDAYRLIGGLAPRFLCREHSQFGPHVGSADVDLMLSPGVFPEIPTLSDRLLKAGLSPDQGDPQSMYWFADKVRVDLLAPNASKRDRGTTLVAGIRAGCPPGTAAVLDSPPRMVSSSGVTIAVAGGPAIIMAKTMAFKDRAWGVGRPADKAKAGKHAYDLVYLMTSYLAGVDTLMKEWKAVDHPELKRTTLDTLGDEFASSSSSGPSLGAGFLRANLGPATGFEEIIRDQVNAFISAVL